MTSPIWLNVMRFAEGLQEIPGPKSNPVILNWNKMINGPKWYDNDDKPWCALALNAVLSVCGLPLAVGNSIPLDKYDLLRAKSFETWGHAIAIPTLGCIMTFSRPEGHHVGLYRGERKDAYYILGANQSNTIGSVWILKKRLTSIRWPVNVEMVSTGRIWLTDSGEVSTNEG